MTQPFTITLIYAITTSKMPQNPDDNLYIILPYTPESLAFVQGNAPDLLNLGNNQVILAQYHPDEENHPFEMVYQIELARGRYNSKKPELDSLGASQGMTAEQYRQNFPPKNENAPF